MKPCRSLGELGFVFHRQSCCCSVSAFGCAFFHGSVENSRVGQMLNRTGADVGSDKMLFKDADIFVFCSAVISREVMEADPMNIAHCPYGIFVAETDDGVMIGRRDYPDGPMEKVEALLDGIINEAAEN